MKGTMDFAFSEEQQQLRASARQFLADRYDDGTAARVADSESGFDADVWPNLAELGWFDPELTFLEYAVLFEETGARLLPAPYFSTVALAGPTLRTDEELAKRLAAGGLRATLAWAEAGVQQGFLDHAGLAARVAGGRLDGHKVLVPDAAAVDLFVVAAREGSRGASAVGLYAVEAAHAEVVPRDTLDRTRRLGEVRFAGASARPLVSPDDADRAVAVLAQTRRWSLAAAPCEAVGVAGRALDLAAEHARSRQQFGRPIGVYQAVSHRVVDSYVGLEEARSLAYWAAWCVAEDDPQADRACLAAKAHAGEAAVAACESAIQVHGGIGFTWEHVLHRYYKRAQWLAAVEGPARDQRAEIAAALLDH
ncbi:MAG: acyl-CoA dehydrogenase [Streptosporangiales bacterium]|nr:acyl-CoA dehydrogenase [Streptosporangiales bacterium]